MPETPKQYLPQKQKEPKSPRKIKGEGNFELLKETNEIKPKSEGKKTVEYYQNS